MTQPHRMPPAANGRVAVPAVLAAAIIFAAFTPVQLPAQSEPNEAGLRGRLTAYWDHMQKSEYTEAAQYVHRDFKAFFVQSVPDGKVESWKISSLAFAPDGKSCEAKVIMRRPIPMFGAHVDLTIRNKWIYENGDWWLWVEPDTRDGFIDLFKSDPKMLPRRDVKDVDENAAAPRKPVVNLLERLVPDPANPTEVHFGEKAVFRYQFKNTGTEVLTVSSVYSDCHCAGTPKQLPEAAPGQTGTIEVTLDTFGLPLGRIEKQLEIKFSDMPEPVVMKLAVDCVPNYALVPSTVDFGDVQAGVESERTITVQNRSGRPFRILSSNASYPGMKLSFDRDVLGVNEKAVLTVRMAAPRQGAFNAMVMVRTDLEAEPIFNVRVKGTGTP